MKPFSWSWSKLKNFRTCPKRHWHVDLQKDFKEAESDQLKWGHDVHDAMAKYIDKGEPLPLTMERFDELPTKMWRLRSAGITVAVEQKLAMTEDFKPCGFFDNGAWYRAVVDVLARGVTYAKALDWKTGKLPDGAEYEQLALSAQVIFAHYPEVEQVDTSFVWLGYLEDDGTQVTTDRNYQRDQMLPVWNGLWPEINVMKEAYRTTTYPPKPSGLCKHYCPVTSCPYHGKGGR